MAAPKLAKGGRALLMKALAAIKRNPSRFRMATFVSTNPEHPCRTTMCLAGWIVREAGMPVTGYWLDPEKVPAKLRRTARALDRSRTFGCNVPSLAAHLVAGPSQTAKRRMEYALFYGHERTPGQISKRVHAWLRTGA